MSKERKFSVSLSNLDKLDLCALYDGEGQIWGGQPVFRDRLLEMTVSSEEQLFTLSDVLASGSLEIDGKLVPVRQTLTPIARLAQADEEILDRLTGFVNDCAIEALPFFENDWPADNRPRDAILATQDLLAGKIDHDEWSKIVREGLSAWAGWFAPQALYASAEWAAWDYRSWLPLSERFGEADERFQDFSNWQDWAEWASLNVLIFLGRDYHQRESPNGLDDMNEVSNRWATNRLAEWLEPDAPAPLALPTLPLIVGSTSSPAKCCARYVKEFEELEWPMLSAFPEGLEEIGNISLERNAVLSVPEGITSIGEIRLNDHPTLELPSSLRTIGYIKAYNDCIIRVPEGVKKIGAIDVERECQVILPSTIEFIASLATGAESELEDCGLPEDCENEDAYWEQILSAEEDQVPDPYGCFIQCVNRRLIKGRTDIHFENGEPQIL